MVEQKENKLANSEIGQLRDAKSGDKLFLHGSKVIWRVERRLGDDLTLVSESSGKVWELNLWDEFSWNNTKFSWYDRMVNYIKDNEDGNGSI